MDLAAPFTLVSPPDRAAWDALAQEAEGATPFHTSAWAHLWLAEWPDAHWQAIVLRDGDAYAGALGFIARPGRLGLRVLSMPYGTYGGPLIRAGHSDPTAVRRGLLEGYRRFVSTGGILASHLTWLGGVRDEAGSGLEATEGFTLAVSLAHEFDDSLQWLPQLVRSPVRQAERNGLSLRPVRTSEDLGVFYDLVTRTADRHEGRAKPLAMFRRVLDDLVPKNLARFDLVYHGDEAIAAGLHLLFRRYAMNWLLASDQRHWNLRPIHLIHARLLRELGEAGFLEYDFGGSPKGADGLIHFKESWGARRRPVITLRRRSLLHRLLRRS